MHELSIMQNILNIILEYAQNHNAKKIKTVNLTIGALSDVIPEWANTYFQMLSKDTIADQAALVIEKIPVVVRCNDCTHEFTVEKADISFFCPQCKSAHIELLSGRELLVTSIEVE